MEKIKQKFREFGLSSLAIDNATSVFLVTGMILIFGLRAYVNIPKEQFPEVNFPTLFVNTPYFGNSAKDIESLVSRPIEKELQGIEGVKSIRSTSIQDYSIITVEFETTVDFDDATRKVKDAVDIAKSELPNDITADPLVQEINSAEIPIVTVNVSGNYGPEDLRKYAEILQDEIENVSEVSAVAMKGDVEREVKIDVDLPKMEARQVSFNDIAGAIGQENMNMSGGEVTAANFRRAIRVKGQYSDPNELRNLIIKSEGQAPVFLRDIANVQFGYKDRTSIARSDGLPVISLDIIKRKGRNLISAAEKVNEVIKETKKTLPKDLKISLFNDQSVNTQNEVSNLENSIISGVILVVLVLLFFLGLRNASFVGIAIPLSMLLGILVISAMGITLNIIVLFGLILALGLLVDNGIVVVENIYRYMQEGYSPADASKYGVGEVAIPIIASTATTLAAFLPIAFWPGLVGDFMKYLPYTLIIVLTSSLFVALVINPVLTMTFMKVEDANEERSVYNRKRRNTLIASAIFLLLAAAGFMTKNMTMQNIFLIGGLLNLINFFIFRPGAFFFQNRILPKLERGYDSFVRFALRIPRTVFLGTIAALIGTFALMAIAPPKVIFFPSADPIYINAFVEMPLGSDIEATNETMKKLEARIDEVIGKYDEIVDAVLVQIGENTSDPNSPPEPGASPNKARMTINFVKAQDRGGISTFDIMEEIRGVAKEFPGVQIAIDKNADGPPTGKPINMEIIGEDLNDLLTESAQIINFINNQNIGGIEELKADVQVGKPELEITVNREAARRYGLSTAMIGQAIRTSVFGQEVSKYKDGEDEYEINLRLAPEYRTNVESIMNQKITFRDPSNGRISQVPIAAVAKVDYTSTYSSIKRKDLDRVVTVYSNVNDGYNAQEINDELRSLMSEYDLPQGITYEFTGEQQQQAEDAAFLGGAFLVAVFVIFIILVSQFNSIISPFIIILSILFSIIGVLLGYYFTGRPYSVIFSSVGIISLAGVVVNNAIVLIDYINLLVKRKREKLGLASMADMELDDVKEAIVQAGSTRLRPVLLTAITTILGLIPLAIGFNFNFFTLVSQGDPQIFIGGDSTAFWGPISWTVIYGLMFATFLTLVVVPVMYWLAYRNKKGVLIAIGGLAALIVASMIF
jgi:multidrug efflux pump subunit AcrB